MRAMLAENLKRLLKSRTEVALAFSGGTDSLCLLFSLVEDLDICPVLYTYVVEGYPSADGRIASRIAEYYSLSHLYAEIPRIALKNDVRRIIKDGIRGQVNIQCMHGHYYVAPLVREPIIVNGSGVDALYGSYRSIAILGRKDKAEFDRLRQAHLYRSNDDAMEYQVALYAKHGVDVVYPYRQANIIQFLMGLSYKEINSPRRKEIIVRDYPQFRVWKDIYRPRGSQQLIAGTKKLHQGLLTSSLNRKDRKSVMWIYKDIAEEMECRSN